MLNSRFNKLNFGFEWSFSMVLEFLTDKLRVKIQYIKGTSVYVHASYPMGIHMKDKLDSYDFT